jgi:hypothetical protein
VGWLRAHFLSHPFSRFISGLVFPVRSLFYFFRSRLFLCAFLIYIIDLFPLSFRRNRSPACHFHRHYRCQFGDIVIWLTADPPWHSTRSFYRSVSSTSHINRLPMSYAHPSIAGGFFSGNAAVIYSALGEITDSTNHAIALPFFALAWPIGSIIG